MPGRDLILLSLDGGGVRGLSALQILKQLMERVSTEAGLDEPQKPCEYFDMIGGTSTGGLMAIMLGRLQMSIDECIEAYADLIDKVFQKKRHRIRLKNGTLQGRFDTMELEQGIKKIIVKCGLHEDALLKDVPGAPCKVFVCAMNQRTSETVCLSSYWRPRGGSDRLRSVKIWEAARATSAATTFFDPVSVKMGTYTEDFIDAAPGANNPVRQVWNEAKDAWDPEPLEQNLRCLISIGTGVPSIKPFGDDALQIGPTLIRISTETEQTAELFQREHSELDDENRYFRFNVRNGLEDIGLEDSKQKDAILTLTDRYVQSQDTFKLVKRCGKCLAEWESFSEDMDVKGANSHSSVVLRGNRRVERYERSKAAFNILDLISAYNHEKVHERLSSKRLAGTGGWFLDTTEVRNWLADIGPRILWYTGIVGSGKTTITTAVVETVKDQSSRTGNAVIYYYCETSQTEKHQAFELLASLLKQSLKCLKEGRKACPRPIFRRIKKLFEYGGSEPDLKDLMDLFSQLFRILRNPTVIIDGLDEMAYIEIESILHVFRQLFQEDGGQKLFVSSREQLHHNINIEHWMPGIKHLQISRSDNFDDICTYVEAKLTEKTKRSRQLTEDDSLSQQVKHKLQSEAQGMFLWVYLQIEELWEKCFTDRDIREALENLPKDLDSTYIRCLQKIERNGNSYHASKVFKWISCTFRPLNKDEMREALTLTLEDTKWVRDRVQSSDSVIKRCGNLVFVEATDQCVRFVHPSVQQYLQKVDQTSLFHVDCVKGQLECGQISVKYLNFSNFSSQVQSSRPSDAEKYKFLPYANESWIIDTIHITTDSPVWQEFNSLAMNPKTSWFSYPWSVGGQSYTSHLHGMFGWAVKARHLPLLKIITNLGREYHFRDFCDLPLLDDRLPALHIASRLGHEEVVRLLLQFVRPDEKDIWKQNALHHASEKGHVEVIRLLLSNHVKADERSALGDTPLTRAVASGEAEATDLLLQSKSGHDAFAATFQTLLTSTVMLGHARVLQSLLSHGASHGGFFKNVDWMNLLLLAANRGHAKVVHQLYDHSLVHATITNKTDQTVLSMAAESAYEELVKLLLKREDVLATLNSRNEHGRSSLSLAAGAGQERVVRLLIHHSIVNVESRDRPGRTPLSYAAGNGHESVVQIFMNQNKALSYKSDYEDKTPLSYAAEGGHERVVQLLIEHEKYYVNSKDTWGQTPLLIATQRGHEAVVQVLLEHKGVDINIQDDCGRTALSYAAEKGYEKIVQSFLKERVDINTQDRQGWTPVDWAEVSEQPEIARLLLAKGARRLGMQ